MMTRLLLLLLVLFPSLMHASTCANLANQINADTTKYAAAISRKTLPWMNLTWLKMQLGKAVIQKISPNQMQYKWVCPENTDAYIAVITDNKGIITQIDGAYNSENGAGILSVCLNCLSAQPAKPTPQVKPLTQTNIAPPQLTPPQLTAPAKTAELTCSDVMKQINDIAQQGGGSKTAYSWESLAWLQNHFGATTLQQNNTVSGYEWKCDSESILYFMKGNQIIYGATKCVNGDCTISYASRINNDMKGYSMKVEPQSTK